MMVAEEPEFDEQWKNTRKPGSRPSPDDVLASIIQCKITIELALK